jgi:hypothetical protein
MARARNVRATLRPDKFGEFADKNAQEGPLWIAVVGSVDPACARDIRPAAARERPKPLRAAFFLNAAGKAPVYPRVF